MAEPLLLLDPGLIVPPAAPDVSLYREFWVGLVEWAADRRVRLGRYSHALVLERLGESWPDASPPNCPQELSRQANFALNTLLSAVADDPLAEDGRVDAFDPEYVLPDLRDGLALDVAEQCGPRLMGAASRGEHWERPVETVEISPGPPDQLRLALAPQVSLPGEVDFRARENLTGRRVTIIGGLRDDDVLASLGGLFPDTGSWRWIAAERGRQPDLGGLTGMRSDRDCLVCITRFLSHAASEKAVGLARSRGVVVLYARFQGNIADTLRDHFGRS